MGTEWNYGGGESHTGRRGLVRTFLTSVNVLDLPDVTLIPCISNESRQDRKQVPSVEFVVVERNGSIEFSERIHAEDQFGWSGWESVHTTGELTYKSPVHSLTATVALHTNKIAIVPVPLAWFICGEWSGLQKTTMKGYNYSDRRVQSKVLRDHGHKMMTRNCGHLWTKSSAHASP